MKTFEWVDVRLRVKTAESDGIRFLGRSNLCVLVKATILFNREYVSDAWRTIESRQKKTTYNTIRKSSKCDLRIELLVLEHS